ncbi:MAG: hypothetical protein IME98_02750 [Proteobacteria bacterium]|nr:hypothetical protein [Pseudomonadota bacterium]
MDREIRVKITPDGKVEVDSTVFTDCTEVANHLANILGKVESLTIKDEHEDKELLKIKK